MKTTLARAAVAGALALGAAPLAAPSQASCVVVEVCRAVCRAGSDVPAVVALCAVI